MKKFLSALLVVLMLASLSVCAFAADSPSTDPSGDAGGATVVPATKPADKEAEEVKEAKEAEAEAAKEIEDTEAEDDVVVALGKLPADATAEMKADFKDLEEALVDAKEALADIAEAAIPEEVTAEVGEDVKVEASQPFRAVASTYPATITIAVENPDNFVGMMVFVNGQWVKLNTTKNADGTVTFVLDQPAVLSIVFQVVEAA